LQRSSIKENIIDKDSYPKTKGREIEKVSLGARIGKVEDDEAQVIIPEEYSSYTVEDHEKTDTVKKPVDQAETIAKETRSTRT